MGKFCIRSVPSGFKFDLKAPNGQTVLTSEVYRTCAACRKGIASVRKNAAAPVEDLTVPAPALPHPKFQLYRDQAGSYRFRLRSRNGAIIAVSDAYTAKASALAGIDSAQKNAPAAQISYLQPAQDNPAARGR